MEHFVMGRIWFFSTLTDSESLRYAKAFAWHARELWKKLCRKKDPKVALIPVLLHRDDKIKPGTCIRYLARLDLLVIHVDFQTVTKMAARLAKRRDLGETNDPTQFVLRAARIILAEELHHMWKFLIHEVSELDADIDSNGRPTPRALVVYYAEDPDEYNALQFVVEVTGERRELLEAVEAYRVSHGLANS